MDFKLEIDGLIPDQTFDKADTILNNLYLSLMVKKGSWFQNPEFGMLDLSREKNTERTAELVVEYAKQATQWIIDAGRALSIDFETERDPLQNPYRLKLLVTAIQADGREISFETFLEVV